MIIKILNKKAMWTWGDILHFIVYYIPMTVIVAILLVRAPTNILEGRIVTGELDNAFLSERIYNALAYKDIDSGRIFPIIKNKKAFNESLVKDVFYFPEEKKFAFKLTLDNKEVIFNKNFYEIAKPLAPVRYRIFNVNKEFYIPKEKSITKLNIEQIYTRRS